MRPKFEILDPGQITRVLEDAQRILSTIGVKVQSHEARDILNDLGAELVGEGDIVRIPSRLVENALKTVPTCFFLFDRSGERVIQYGENEVHFDPGSSGVHILDPDSLEHRTATTPDLVKLIKVTEGLSQYAAQSTAVVCSDVPPEIGDLYRMYLVLMFSKKPIITGSFSLKTLDVMLEMLSLFAGGRENLAARPTAVFDVCPTPPLIWSEFACGNLITLSKAGVPAEMVSMPLAGAAAPVTLLGSVTQHAAESLAGIVIHQSVNPGAPIVWGGAPAIFDMRKGGTPFGAIETAMINIACAEIGKSLHLPTHGYLGASDSKVIDAQAGMESSTTALLGALAGINMISGAGMLDFLACLSPEKLVIDAEAIASALRLIRGIPDFDPDQIFAFYQDFHFKGDFLKQPITRELFAREQYLPGTIIDRDSLRGWQSEGSHDTLWRARRKVEELIAHYQPLAGDDRRLAELKRMVGDQAARAGMQTLPTVQ